MLDNIKAWAARILITSLYALIALPVYAQGWDRNKNIEAAVNEAYSAYASRTNLAAVAEVATKCYDRLKKRGLNRPGAAKEVEYCVSQDLVGEILLNVHGLGRNDQHAVLWEPLELKDGKTSPISFRLVQLDIMSAAARTDEEEGRLLRLWSGTVRRLVDQRLASGDTGKTQVASGDKQLELAKEGLRWAWGAVKARMQQCGGKTYIVVNDGALYQILQPKLGLLKQKQLTEIDQMNGLEWDGEIVLVTKAARAGLFYQNPRTGDVRWQGWKEWEDVKHQVTGGLRKKKGAWEIYSATWGTNDPLYVLTAIQRRPGCEAIPEPE